MPLDLSLILPALNEGRNIFPVFEEIASIHQKFPFLEILVVDDGSSDQTLFTLKKARKVLNLPIRIFSHPKSLGKSASLYTAISQAKSHWIATMDADGQDDPAFIPVLFKKALSLSKEGKDPLVIGIRQKREDKLSRRFATRIANRVRSFLLKDHCSDTAAPLKVFSKDVFLSLPQFEGMHRFLPAFMKMRKGSVCMIPIIHRSRLFGHSKYTNYSRALIGIVDLLGVYWLSKRYRHIFFSEH
ncbi:glycosyltransferase family 2 protein [Acetobacteraceae bacterium]|nr:glycosyltransferase family 2 protein [Acetobacteraceae bacterium]